MFTTQLECYCLPFLLLWDFELASQTLIVFPLLASCAIVLYWPVFPGFFLHHWSESSRHPFSVCFLTALVLNNRTTAHSETLLNRRIQFVSAPALHKYLKNYMMQSIATILPSCVAQMICLSIENSISVGEGHILMFN